MPRSDPPAEEPSPGVAQTLYDPRAGDPALQVADLNAAALTRPHRTNCFALYWVRARSGSFWADDARHPFAAPCLLCFSPYQAVRLTPEAELTVTAVRFHAKFLCVEPVHPEVGCKRVVVND